MEWNLLAFDSDFKMSLECFLHGIYCKVDVVHSNRDRWALVLKWYKQDGLSLGTAVTTIDYDVLDYYSIVAILLLERDLVYSLSHMERTTSENADGIESYVEETMNWRYCWRAGVMSRNEGKKKEELLV